MFCATVYLSLFSSKTMYDKTILLIRFSFCDMLNNQGLSKCYQPRPSGWLITLTYLDLRLFRISQKPHPIIILFIIAFPRIIAPFWSKKRNNCPLLLFEEMRYTADPPLSGYPWGRPPSGCFMAVGCSVEFHHKFA